MSIDIRKLDYPVRDNLKTKIVVPEKHFLITLAIAIPWKKFSDLAINELYKNKKRSGRKLNLRLHLGAFILQTLFRWTDRELEENLNYYAPARVFCAIEGRAYDHSAYVKFRGRLSGETAKKFNASLLKTAHKRGFTGSQFMDFDSTVQEANIEYPTDIRMMQSIFRKGIKLMKKLSENGSHKAKGLLEKFDIKQTTKNFKAYFFAKKNKKGKELRSAIFSESHRLAVDIVESIKNLKRVFKRNCLPWNYKRDLKQLESVAPKLLKQIKYFIEHGQVAPGKILSLHAKEVKCISKGKTGKKYEFGRNFFIGRLPGNYAFSFTDDDWALEDAYSLERGIREYREVFDDFPESISADRGFWSPQNLEVCKDIKEIGIAPRGNKNWKIPQERVEELQTRRSKVEPIIGHLKRRGMGRSKMKSDEMTKLDGQRAALSLNLGRMARDLSKEVLKWAG